MPTPQLSLEELGKRMDALGAQMRQGIGLNEACRRAVKTMGISWNSLRQNYFEAKRRVEAGERIVIPAIVLAPLEDRLVDLLRRRPRPTATIIEQLDCSRDDLQIAVLSLKEQGVNVLSVDGSLYITGENRPAYVQGPSFELYSDDDDTFRFGALGDSHLCSKYERIDVLNDLYDQYAEEGFEHVFHTGNWIDGEARFNMFDVHTHGVTAQCDYLACNYPQRDGILTAAIAGDDHEGWYAQKFGLDIGKTALNSFDKAGRTDWVDLGYMSAHVKLINKKSGAFSIMNVMHPGGGSAYAISYTVQKIVESFEGGEKPAILLAGHYHKMECANVRNVWCLQTGCTQDQTPFMMKKRLEAHIGGVKVTCRQDPRTGAITSFLPDMQRYFNRGYYGQRWSHSGPVVQPERSRNQAGNR